MRLPVLRQAIGASAVLGREVAAAAAAAARQSSSLSTATRSPTMARTAALAFLRPHARLLSTTARCSAQAVTFEPTSSRELDAALDMIRTKIILPSYLGAEQRRKMFDKKYEERLRADPLTLDMDGTVYKFTYVNKVRDLPHAWRATRAAVERMETAADFAQLPRLLEGLQHAGRHVKPRGQAWLARRAADKGQLYVVLECARMARRTGYVLGHAEVALEVLTQVQRKALASGWDEAETRQALGWAEMVVDLLEEPVHVRRTERLAPLPPRKDEVPPPFPLARDPLVLAARLHLAAVVADKFADAAAAQLVQQYGAQLAAIWQPATAGVRRHSGLYPPGAFASKWGELNFLEIDNKFLVTAVPLLHGLHTAVRVLETTGAGDEEAAATAVDVARQLAERRDVLDAEVQAALKNVPDLWGAQLYKKLFGGEE